MADVTKVLFGVTSEITALLAPDKDKRDYLEKNGIDLLTFAAKDSDIIFDPVKHNYSFLDNALKLHSFIPDIILIVTAGYDFLLEGIEDSPYPVFLLHAEWFLTAQTLHYQSKRVDHIIAVSNSSYEAVKSITGVPPICTSLPSLLDEWPVFYPMPDIEKIYDVAYIGNSNPRIHPARTYLLEKLALLPEKYNVFIGETISNGMISYEYANLINNQSKICVNVCAPWAKMVGTRVYHTSLSSSFVLTEHLDDENDYLTEGVNCAFFTEDRLEEKIEYYLKNEEEREKIAKKACELALAGKFNFTSTLLNILEKVKSLKKATNRTFNGMPKFQQFINLGSEILLAPVLRKIEGINKALNYFSEAIKLSPDNLEAINGAAVIYSLLAINNPNHKQFSELAIQWFERGSLIQKTDIIRLFNEAYFYKNKGIWTDFCNKFLELDTISDIYGEELLKYFPHTGIVSLNNLDYLSQKKWQQLYCFNLNNGNFSLEFYNQIKKWILWKTNEWMAEYLIAQKKHNEAVSYYMEACNYMPDADTSLEQLGNCLAGLGEINKARESYEKCLKVNPLNASAAANLCEILIVWGNVKEGKDLAKKYRLICKRIKSLQNLSHYFENALNA